MTRLSRFRILVLQMSDFPKLETTTQAARRVGVSARTLLRWLEAGLLPGIQTAGGHWRIDRADLEAFLAGPQRDTAAPQPLGGPRIRVVEDDPAHAAALARLLRLFSPLAQVHHAADGLSAALLLGTTLPHVAFVDIELPGMDGVALLRLARQQPALGNVQFVVVSGRLSAQRIDALQALGIQHILPKPLAPADVRRVLEEVLPVLPALASEPQRQPAEIHV